MVTGCMLTSKYGDRVHADVQIQIENYWQIVSNQNLKKTETRFYFYRSRSTSALTHRMLKNSQPLCNV